MGALLAAFGQAPFAHFHEHLEAHDHDFTSWVEVEEDGGSHVEHPDHDADAHAKDWLAGDGSAAADTFVELASSPSEPMLVTVEEIRLPLRPQSHDPPVSRLLPSRAPPAANLR